MSAAPPAGRRKQFVSLGAALVAASGLGFLLLGMIGRWLPRDDGGQLFLSLWGLVFGFGSVLAATEQEIARQTTVARLEGRRAPASVLQWAASGLAGTAVGLGLLWLARPGLFADSVVLVGLAAIALVGFTGQFLTRGILLGRAESGPYAMVVLLEAAIRVVPAALLLALAVQPSVALALAAVVLGCFGWLVYARTAARAVDPSGPRQHWGAVVRGLALLAGANALSSLVLTAFPTLVTAVLGEQPGLAVLFAVVTLSRVPLVLIAPLQAMVVPIAVEYLHGGRGRDLAALQVKGGFLGMAAGLLLAAGGYVLGPWAVRLFMGPQYEASPVVVATTFAASAVMALALLQAAVFIALERYSLVAITWGVAVLVAVSALYLAPGTPADRALTAFVVATLAGYSTSGLLLRGALRSHATPRADS